ncbi:MAG: PilZ domain-containing protein [Candidatus Omnitrophica bacterium]|nr:PilZ domain-containing protein [Candidatus Omnitrophota bacterium]
MFNNKPQKPSTPKEQEEEAKWVERRTHRRINKNFILNYFEKDNPSTKIELTQLKNISKGGLCFITTKAYPPSTKIAMELRTPYLSDITYLEGFVLASHPKVEGIIYETRLQFETLSPQADFLITKMMEVFDTQGDNIHE